jgi:hypothetical protein
MRKKDSSNTFRKRPTSCKRLNKYTKYSLHFTTFFPLSGTWLKIVQGLDLKICRLSVLSLVYFALFRLYELSPVNRKRFGSSAIICKPVTNLPLRLHLAK